jgi:hypothetical protein
MKEKPNYYAILTAEVRYSKALTPNAKILYAELTALCNMNGKCTASTEYFCRLYEVSRVSIQKWLKNLEDNNHIRRVNIYKQGSKEILTRVITLINTPSKEKFTDNTNINIINTNLTDSNTKSVFKIPTIIDIKEYCKERKNNVDCETFFDFYESKGWQIGKEKMKNWKACVRTWEKSRNNKTNTNDRTTPHFHQKGKDYGDGTF